MTADNIAVTVKLKKPVSIDGASVSEIKLREPNMNDLFASGVELMQIEKLGSAQLNKLIANLANWTPEQVGTMSPGDWMKVTAKVTDFLS